MHTGGSVHQPRAPLVYFLYAKQERRLNFKMTEGGFAVRSCTDIYLVQVQRKKDDCECRLYPRAKMGVAATSGADIP